jgi:hypothetical protein
MNAARTPVPWVPVHDHGCGWRECPECGPLIEVEIQTKHERMVKRSFPSLSQMSDWLADMYGTGADRSPALVEKRKAALVERDRRRAEIRIKRSLSGDAVAEVFVQLRARPVRKQFDRNEWTSEVWLELLNPTKLIALREKRMPLKARVCRAIKRAEYRMWKEQNGNA